MTDYEDDSFDYNFTWNHRVVKTTGEFEGQLIEDFQIVEVQYRDGIPSSYCDPFVQSDTLEGLSSILEQMKEALKKPILLHEDFSDYEDEDDNA